MIKVINEVNFEKWEEENNFGEFWEDEIINILPDEIKNFLTDRGIKVERVFPEKEGDVYYEVKDEDGEYYEFYTGTNVTSSLCEYARDNYNWKNLFANKERNADIIQSRVPGMFPPDSMKEAIEEYLKDFVRQEDDGDIDDVDDYVYWTYMDAPNGWDCTDEAIEILMSDNNYEDFMTRLLSNESNFIYFLDEYGFLDQWFDDAFEPIGGEWYYEIDE